MSLGWVEAPQMIASGRKTMPVVTMSSLEWN